MSLSQWIASKSSSEGRGRSGRRLVADVHGNRPANMTSFEDGSKMQARRKLQMHSLNSMCQHLVRDQQPAGGGSEAEILHKIRTGDWLVLVLERFDESLLLLREAYGWDLIDILYVAMKTTRSTHKTPLSET